MKHVAESETCYSERRGDFSVWSPCYESCEVRSSHEALGGLCVQARFFFLCCAALWRIQTKRRNCVRWSSWFRSLGSSHRWVVNSSMNVTMRAFVAVFKRAVTDHRKAHLNINDLHGSTRPCAFMNCMSFPLEKNQILKLLHCYSAGWLENHFYPCTPFPRIPFIHSVILNFSLSFVVTFSRPSSFPPKHRRPE